MLALGNPYRGLWFFSMVFLWFIVALSIYASYVTTPELAREDPLAAFGWAILPALLAVGATWVWWDNVSWWREAKKVASLIRWYKDGEVGFAEEVEASAGAVIVRSRVSYVPSALPGRVRAVMEYEAVFAGPEEGVRGDRFRLPDEALESAGVIYRGYYWLAATLPAILVKRPVHDVIVMVYDPAKVPRRTYSASDGPAEVTAETSGWGVKVIAAGEPGTRAWATLTCRQDEIEAKIKLLNGEHVPTQKEIALAPKEPTIIVSARYSEEPKHIMKALHLKRQTAIGAALNHCELEVKTRQ